LLEGALKPAALGSLQELHRLVLQILEADAPDVEALTKEAQVCGVCAGVGVGVGVFVAFSMSL
jgi:hypothetical protein